jgi:hypothetical protein
MRHTHVAGIIPVSGLETDYNIDTPEFLLPLEPGFTAIQKSVYECAIAGCQTIWIVANQDLAPIVRKRVGEWTYDPVYFNRFKYGEGSENRREVPIYYVPIHPKDRDRRDSYGWSILNGIYGSWRVANHISKWIVPEKYFISFPMSAYDIHQLRHHRQAIADLDAGFFMSYNDETVLDNKPLCFTMTGRDYINCRRDVNKKTTREFYNTEEGERYPSRKLPIEKRWSAKNFSLSDVFDKLEGVESHIYEPDWFYDLSTWEGYRTFLTSENSIKKPADILTQPHIHVKIPYKA